MYNSLSGWPDATRFRKTTDSARRPEAVAQPYNSAALPDPHNYWAHRKEKRSTSSAQCYPIMGEPKASLATETSGLIFCYSYIPLGYE